MSNFPGDFFGVIRYAVRTLLRSPGYTSAALRSLGPGIGANTAISTITSAAFLHSLPISDPAGVLELYTVGHATQPAIANLNRSCISIPNVRDIQAQNGIFNGVAGFFQAGVRLSGFGKPFQQPAFGVPLSISTAFSRARLGKLSDLSEPRASASSSGASANARIPTEVFGQLPFSG